MEEEKYLLNILGITYNQIESGVYAVILEQVGTSRRIPIIIGTSEAQAIECKLQNITTPRPLTHDLMMNTLKALGIELEEVLLKKLPNGVFAADLILTQGMRTYVIDSRSSDAIALAIRFGAPIYTTAKVLREAGFEPRDAMGNASTPSDSSAKNPETTSGAPATSNFASLSDEQLMEAMQRAAETENYEEAARIKAELDRRKNNCNQVGE